MKRAGTDVTLVAWSHMVVKALARRRDSSTKPGISVEVVDLRTLVPMDVPAILASVRKTGRLVIAQEAVRRGGVASDIAAIVARAGPRTRSARRSSGSPGLNTPIPFNLALERAVVPQVEDLVAAVRSLMGAAEGPAA